VSDRASTCRTSCPRTSWTLKPSSSLYPSGKARGPISRFLSSSACTPLDARGQARPSTAFLDLSGHDPCQARLPRIGRRPAASQGPIFVYNAGFETARIRELAERFPDLAPHLLALNERVVDLLAHRAPALLPPQPAGQLEHQGRAACPVPGLRYSDLDGVQDGGMAHGGLPGSLARKPPARKAEIERQLLAYCALDTWAMVRLWAAFTANTLKV
jgi:hypothetical protein